MEFIDRKAISQFAVTAGTWALAVSVLWPQVAAASERQALTVTARFTKPTSTLPALLVVTARIPSGSYLYAVDQEKLKDGIGPPRTQVLIKPQESVKALGPFQPLGLPSVHADDGAFPGLELRVHEKRVTWCAPIELPADADKKGFVIEGQVKGLVCNQTSCMPAKVEFRAELGDAPKLPKGFSVKTESAGGLGSTPKN